MDVSTGHTSRRHPVHYQRQAGRGACKEGEPLELWVHMIMRA